jgi:hypothetical protein
MVTAAGGLPASVEPSAAAVLLLLVVLVLVVVSGVSVVLGEAVTPVVVVTL